MNSRRPQVPGPIVDRWGRSPLMQNNVRMPGEWWQPKLANVKTSVTTRLDAGAGGATQAADGTWTVNVQGGATCAKPGEGVLYGWDLTPTATFDGWKTADVVTMFTALEVTDNTGLGSSELYIVCGVCDVGTSMPASPAGFTGLHYDGSAAANPDVRAGIGNDVTGNDSGSQANDIGVSGMIQSMPGQVIFFVALGRSATDAGTESISFKLHVALSGRQEKWFP